jgi:hypothetical protein
MRFTLENYERGDELDSQNVLAYLLRVINRYNKDSVTQIGGDCRGSTLAQTVWNVNAENE